jgi:hypothetical protein
MYIMFAVFSRVVQSIFVFCMQLSRVIVSDTFVVTCPFMYTLFICVVMDIVLLRRSYCQLYSIFSTCASVQCSYWLISLYLVLIKIWCIGDTMQRMLLNFVFKICGLKCENAYLLKYLNTSLCSVLYHTWNCYNYVVFFCFSIYSFNIPPLMLNLLRLI